MVSVKAKAVPPVPGINDAARPSLNQPKNVGEMAERAAPA
jgi:hypothetical protein